MKFKFFGNPISPFFESFFNVNNELIRSFAINLRSSEGWLGNTSDLKIFLKPFIPISFSQLSNTLGLLFLLQLINLPLLKKTKFIPIVIIAFILSTGQLLPRYYFEAFLILSFYYTIKNNNLIDTIKFLQGFAILILSIAFLFISYFKTNVIFDKHKFMERFAYSFYNSQKYNDFNIAENVLVFPQDRQSMFFKKNIYATRGIYVKSLTSTRSDAILSFLGENSIKYIISSVNQHLPDCIVLNKIGEIYQKQSIRNFFLNSKRKNYNIYSIDMNNCEL